MDGIWLTYRDLAEQWNCSVEAVRRRALRGRWRKQLGNDGKARILVPDGVEIEPRTGRVPDAQGDGRPDESNNLLDLHTLSQSHAETVNALEAHNATLKADVEKLEAQLAAANARADAAIAAFASLADRLDALAAVRARPWWKRIAG